MKENSGLPYDMEKLLPVLQYLTDKYTSKESSSVTYETAQMLMKSILYCIQECFGGQEVIPAGGELPDALVMYHKGYDRVIDKVHEAKALYEQITESMDTYGCRNYSDTIRKGMPAFFVRYDARFRVQDHILTLDYPLLTGNPDHCGVNRILEYLEGIRKEKLVLSCFPKTAVKALLSRLQINYQTMFYENICYAVLLQAIGCMIADCPIDALSLGEEDAAGVEFYFRGEQRKKMEQKIRKLLWLLLEKAGLGEEKAYFDKLAAEYAVRIQNGIETETLPVLFAV